MSESDTSRRENMPCKTLTEEDVEIELAVFPEEDLPVVGNACYSGEEEYDQMVEDEILARLEQNDVWAWAMVRVSVEWEGLSSTQYLGGCCYESEEDFRSNSGYFECMVREALDKLNNRLRKLYERMSA
jgi:hypothetical protein